MKKLLLIIAAALSIASTAHAGEWYVHRTCHLRSTDPANTTEINIIMREDALEIQKLIPRFKEVRSIQEVRR